MTYSTITLKLQPYTQLHAYGSNPSDIKRTPLLVDESSFYGGEGGVCFSAKKPRRLQHAPGMLSRVAFQIPIFTDKTAPRPFEQGAFLWRRRRDLNPRYPFGVYTISNRARSASYATSPSLCFWVSQSIILHLPGFVKPYFNFSQICWIQSERNLKKVLTNIGNRCIISKVSRG